MPKMHVKTLLLRKQIHMFRNIRASGQAHVEIRINDMKPMYSYSKYHESVKMSLKTPEIDKSINIGCNVRGFDFEPNAKRI